jgi:hypothetical protein
MRKSSTALAQAAGRNLRTLCGVTGCVFAALTIGSVSTAAQTSTEENLATNAGALDFFRPPIMLKQSDKAGRRFEEKSSRFSSSLRILE